MTMHTKGNLLFIFNSLDGFLTLYWVRNNIATEGNPIMDYFLNHGDLPFLLVKLLMGLIATVVLTRYGHIKIARVGLTFVLYVYSFIMLTHFFTAYGAFGGEPEVVLQTVMNAFSAAA